MNPRYPEVAARARHRCEYCRAPEAAFNLAFEVEHIVPLSQGGADTPDNLALACRSCNLYKAAKLTCPDPATDQQAGLFHPRRDAHAEHFRIDPGLAFVGRTPTGRATLECLRLNSARQVRVRRTWQQLGLFPEQLT